MITWMKISDSRDPAALLTWIVLGRLILQSLSNPIECTTEEWIENEHKEYNDKTD